MFRRCPVVAVAALLALGLGARPAGAQEAPPKAPVAEVPTPDRMAGRRSPTATLRVQVVIARFQGEKKLASLPYSFVVTANGQRARMRMGIDTPVPVSTFESSDPKASVSATRSIQYKNVGTNIDCGANDLGDGRYQLALSIENSSALTGAERGSESTLPGIPLFRRFESSLDPVLRDGQSVQTVASTDPVTGEVVKIDVTLNVVK